MFSGNSPWCPAHWIRFAQQSQLVSWENLWCHTTQWILPCTYVATATWDDGSFYVATCVRIARCMSGVRTQFVAQRKSLVTYFKRHWYNNQSLLCTRLQSLLHKISALCVEIPARIKMWMGYSLRAQWLLCVPSDLTLSKYISLLPCIYVPPSILLYMTLVLSKPYLCL